MKKFLFILLSFFLYFSCSKESNYLIPEDEVPQWLKNKISSDEQIIQRDPRLMQSLGVWKRFRWQNFYYFEYSNVVSSSMYSPISESCDTIKANQTDLLNAYNREKCCKQYVWKGPSYRDY